jgi:hypothetical protein
MLTKRAEFRFGDHGRVITLTTEDKECLCMLQAFYSRNPNPVEALLEQVQRLGPANFMSKWYIGYGHDSIGDSATDTLFIEGIADNEAEDLQNHPLARLQRASTRMMDFSKVVFILPTHARQEHRDYVESLRTFYLEAGPILEEHLIQKNGINLEAMTPQEKTATLASIKAARFDILRGFLPAGVSTNMSLTLSLRAFKDHLNQMQNFPNPRVQEIVKVVRTALQEKHPSSFPDRQTPEQGAWLNAFYSSVNTPPTSFKDGVRIPLNENGDSVYFQTDDFSPLSMPKEVLELLRTRPPRTPVPKEFNRYGTFCLSFMLDHGSARDLKRHNSLRKEYDRLSTAHGFESWYLDQLPSSLRERAVELLDMSPTLFEGMSDYDIEYFMPMGYRVAFKITAGLADLIYLLELRCGDKVHPTLREPLRHVALYFEDIYPDITLYADTAESKFSFTRGSQTIVQK